jgi:hypothetical protein
VSYIETDCLEVWLTISSIPTRRELVREAARNPTTTELKESLKEQEEYYWSTDPLSKAPLEEPVVSDCSGRLYSKTSILEFLIPSEDESSKLEAEKLLKGEVKSLRDIVELKFESNKNDKEAGKGGFKARKWICPITHDLLGPGCKAVYIVPCGHVFSASAMKEVSDGKCLQVGTAHFLHDDND